VDIVDQAALFFESAVDGVSGGRGLLESLSKCLSGFLKALPTATEVGISLTDDEAESGG
jgi:hypothetical protein